MEDLTGTVWSNGGRSEYVIRSGDEIVARSGLIFCSNAAARRAMMKAAVQIRPA